MGHTHSILLVLFRLLLLGRLSLEHSRLQPEREQPRYIIVYLALDGSLPITMYGWRGVLYLLLRLLVMISSPE